MRRFAPGYLERFGDTLPLRQRQVLQTNVRCRTPALGGQLFGCPDCQKFRYVYLGAQLALLGVLQSWSRTLIFHPHVHYLIPGGGLSLDERTWISSGPKFFLADQPLALRFRTLFAEKLKKQAPELYAQIPPKIWTP